MIVCDSIRETDFEFKDGSFFAGNVCLGVEWDGVWKLQWLEGIFLDADDNEVEFTADSYLASDIMRKLNNEIAFRSRAEDWAEMAITEHRADAKGNYIEY